MKVSSWKDDVNSWRKTPTTILTISKMYSNLDGVKKGGSMMTTKGVNDLYKSWNELNEEIDRLNKDTELRNTLYKEDGSSQYLKDECTHIVSCNDDSIWDCIKQQRYIESELEVDLSDRSTSQDSVFTLRKVDYCEWW